MTFDIGVFRTAFPEFADNEVYTNDEITFWAELAEMQLRQCIWKNAWIKGVSLYVAHEITLAAQNKKASNSGGVPGTSGGIANTKTVGNATIGYDTVSSAEKDAGWWNLTNYGKQLYHLFRIFGAGAVQL